MIQASQNEYKLLKVENAEIKACITRYIGYIISVTGVAGLLVNYLQSDERDVILMCILAGSLLIITLLFDVIWYKFKSHNRHVGYIQLLTQEIGFKDLSEEQAKGMLKDPKKGYLDEWNFKFDDNVTPKSDIFSWEFIMARLNTAEFNNAEKKVRAATEKMKFSFHLPDNYKYDYVNEDNRVILDQLFFDNIISKIYGDGTSRGFFKIILSYLANLICSIIDLYLPIKYSLYKYAYSNVERKYLTTSWLYPKKVLQIIIIPVAVICGAFFVLFYRNFTTVDIAPWPIKMTLPYALFYGVIVILIGWILRYIKGLNDLIHGKESIEYFCWTFFIFRVQFLNSNNIFPIVFSRNFIRYFKSRLNVQTFDELFQLQPKNENCICSACKKYKKSQYYSLPLSDQTLTESIKTKIIEDTKFTETDLDKLKFCRDCGDAYIDRLLMGKKLKQPHLVIHRLTNNARKELV